MNIPARILIGATAVVLLGACGTSNKSDSAGAASSTRTAESTATLPSANEPPMTKTSPVEGGAPQTTTVPTTPGVDHSATTTPGAAPVAAAGIALSDVQNPKQTLAKATVKDVKGEAVGEVKSIRVGKDGKVAAVNVAVGSRTVALKPDTLTYVQAENTIQSQQSKDEIAKAR